MEGGRNRYVKKLLSKKNWYKKRGEASDRGGEGETRRPGIESENKSEERDETEPETVMFLPSTPRGELMKKLKEERFRNKTDKICREGWR